MKCLLILLFCFPLIILAQNKPLVIEGVSPNLYVNHTVAPKENYYSIGRIYNISPKEIAPFNNLTLEGGLNPGQVLKIPLSAANFLQTGQADADEVLVPVYHTVADKEGLYRVSTNYNKVPLESIKKWNHLSSDELSAGANLIVGYLKVKKDLSSLAGMAKVKPVDDIAANEGKQKTAEATKEITKASQKEIAQQKDVAKETAPVEPVNKEMEQQTTTKEAVIKKDIPASRNRNLTGGLFSTDYERQARNKNVTGESGQAAIFKSTSGWEDGKYYCLHNSSTPGTILKITSTLTGKSVYAKVLDVMPDIRQNDGLLLIISNAAANELGTNDAKFDCRVTYYK